MNDEFETVKAIIKAVKEDRVRELDEALIRIEASLDRMGAIQCLLGDENG